MNEILKNQFAPDEEAKWDSSKEKLPEMVIGRNLERSQTPGGNVYLTQEH